MVTHQLQFLQKADRIVILNNGKILATGSFPELMDSGIDFLAFLNVSKANDEVKNVRKASSLRDFNMDEVKEEKSKQEEELAAAERQALREETSKAGSVPLTIYWQYFKAGGNVAFISFAFAVALFSQAMFHYMDFWLSDWTEVYAKMNQTRTDFVNGTEVTIYGECEDSSSQTGMILTYSGLMVILFVSTFARTTSFFLLCLRACVRMHNTIFTKVLRSPLVFFENNPMGEFEYYYANCVNC